MMVAMKKWQLMLLLLTAPANAQTENNVCDFCADGSALDPAFSDVEIEVDGSSITCADYSDEVALFLDFCSNVDYKVTGSFCGCPDPVPCSFCADGSDFDAAFADVVVDTDDDTGENVTCADAAVSPEIVFQNSMDCPLNQIQAFISCGCPTAPEDPGTGLCSFCSDGSGLKDEFTDTEVVDQETGDTATCGQVALAFPFLEEELFCSIFQSVYSTQCGCSSDPSEPGCSFCADGSDPADGFEDVVAFVDDDGEDTTCADLAFGLPFLPVDDTTPEICTSLQFQTFASCGCSAPPTGVCTLCADGSAVPDESFELLPEATCGELSMSAAPSGPEECTAFQVTAGIYCGCDINAISTVENICRLCGGTNLLPEVSRQIQFEGDEETCGFAEFSANQNETCSSMQATYGPQCCSTVVSTTPSPSKMPSKSPTTTTGSTTPAPSTSSDESITDTIGSTTSAPSPSSGAILVKVGLPIFVAMVAAFFTL
uniref:Uncharacterized protein n=1 Tax=Attheya septentrionalis TaxID=420275 RepID=A0A7S2U6Y0_9STRA|mmetsp:Transcript_13062/g.23685  ORF Transcript_13062/g.23685 Transcript_13062/m.23685 type:complete len:485 (+) Transcript_13062:36-1490(+)